MTPAWQLEVQASAADVASAVASELLKLAQAAVTARGRFTLALAGGKTPEALYQRLADPEGPFEAAFPWLQTLLVLGDERCVPETHPDSNARMVREALQRSSRAQSARLLTPMVSHSTPATARETYETRLRAELGAQVAWPTLDAVLLGLGADGHTASLFPNAPALSEQLLWVARTHSAETHTERLTLTLPLFNSARAILVIATGHSKASIVETLWQAPASAALPASLVQPTAGNVKMFLDQEAAAMLART